MAKDGFVDKFCIFDTEGCDVLCAEVGANGFVNAAEEKSLYTLYGVDAL